MDWFPLLNSLRVAAISSVFVFFLGLALAYYIAKLPRLLRGTLDVLLTLPLVLPPTVTGFVLLLILGAQHPLGAWVLEAFGVSLVKQWWSAVFAAFAVSFPLMYRAACAAFERFDTTLADAGRTLGLSNSYIFWRLRMPNCRKTILAGAVLSFARALGEYGVTSMLAGCVPGETAVISTEVYQLWLAENETAALEWVLVSLAISAAALLTVNMLEKGKR